MSIALKFPINSYVRVGSRWYRVFTHERDGVTVSTYAVDTGKSMAIHCTVIDEVDTMGRPRKTDAEKAQAKASKEVNGLLEAVKFCAGGFNETGETYSTHAMIAGGYITTYNGVVTYGCKIETTLQALPHYGSLLAGLKATDGGVQITQLDSGRLSIKGKGFRTIVRCLSDPNQVMRHVPDPPCGMIDSRIREGFEIVKTIITKRGDTVMEASVQIRSGDMVATDRQILINFWHGIHLPVLAVPAEFVEAVLKTPKSLVSFGFTPEQSLTFWFEDQSYIRTQLYAEKYPDVDKALNVDWALNMQQLPDTFFEGLERIEPFLSKERSWIYAQENKFTTDPDADVGTMVDCGGLLYAHGGLDVGRLIKLKGKITHIDYTDATICKFTGNNVRGVLCQFIFDSSHEKPAETYDPPAGVQEPWEQPSYGQEGSRFAPPQPVISPDDGPPVFETEEVETGPVTVYAGGFTMPTI